ncbi:hypothetical protein RHMOL_Rhmol01G0283700 [Rhododendron molle]|uniref:Uncharacterized protein n=1 Tax=Rhododendron molle TaxID=49168 RepID=A0ACC0Q7T3_RHOML|nr:hypothetical protein RHMOL_Rhmol01G0283700 [Rhododendron molle]
MEAGENLLHTMQLATYADRLVYDNNCCSICLHHYGPGDMVCFYLPCLQHVHNRCQQQWHIQNCPNCNTIWSFIGLRHPSRVDDVAMDLKRERSGGAVELDVQMKARIRLKLAKDSEESGPDKEAWKFKTAVTEILRGGNWVWKLRLLELSMQCREVLLLK